MSTLDVTVPRGEARVHDAPERRVAPHKAIQQALTIAWRNLVQIKHSPLELVDLSIQPLMFVVLFAYVFGGAISGSPEAYLQFGLTGIIVQNALFLTLTTAIGLNTDVTKGIFDRFRSLPIARSAPLAGRIAADMVRQLWSVTILLVVGLALGFRFHTGPLEVAAGIGVLLAFVLCFSWVSVLIGLLVSEPEKVQIFGFVLLFPLTFASGAFVPAHTMPGWMQDWVRIDPVTMLSDALRGAFVGGPILRPALEALAVGLAIAAVFAPLALRAFRRRA
jgi:ABC-2 type transport system permease protein/oleandomycin transport system permease protein